MKRKFFDSVVNAALLEAQAPIAPSPERARALRARVLAGIHAAAPAGALEHLTVFGAEGIWVAMLPGIEMKLLREDADTRSYLLRMAAGACLPGHGHSQDEECMVLEGDVWLGDTHAHAGDYHLARGGLAHAELHSDGGCLLFLRGQKHYPDLHA
jgi:hypothetical protein